MELTLEERVELLEDLVRDLYEDQASGYYRYQASRAAFWRVKEDREAKYQNPRR